MPTIKEWISCLAEIWGGEIEIIRYSGDEIVFRLRQPKVDVNQKTSLSKRLN